MEGQKRLFEILKSQIKNYQLVDVVSELLDISDDAAYRRIRGVTELSYSELMKIARTYNLSIDTILGIDSPYRSLPFQLFNQDYFDLEAKDYRMATDYVAAIRVAGQHPKSEFGFASNIMPMHTMVLYSSIFRFFMLKWMYQFGGLEKAIPYDQVVIPAQLREVHVQYLSEIQKINYTYIIYHEMSMQHLIHDIQFFHAIRLINDEGITELKNCLKDMLDNLEWLINHGAYPETNNKIDIYVSGLNFETSYSYLLAGNTIIAMIDAFTMGAVTSQDPPAGDFMLRWMNSMKRTSTLVTGSEKNRILFLEKQRETLNKL